MLIHEPCSYVHNFDKMEWFEGFCNREIVSDIVHDFLFKRFEFDSAQIGGNSAGYSISTNFEILIDILGNGSIISQFLITGLDVLEFLKFVELALEQEKNKIDEFIKKIRPKIEILNKIVKEPESSNEITKGGEDVDY